MKPTTIVAATRSFEKWLATHIPVVKTDLVKKHEAMASDPFIFLRATFYRWAQVFPTLCGDLMDAAVVRAVCDLHVENYSTWRDGEGRLIWGINDFDEAYHQPYTLDLVRLGTSTKLAIRASKLSIRVSDACAVILDGYREGLARGIKPIVLAEENVRLGRIVSSELRHPKVFWAKLDGQVNRRARVGDDVKQVLRSHMPEPGIDCTFGSRTAGKGSLGRPRFVALGHWNGARIAREAKMIVPSACVWAGLGEPASVGRRIRESLLVHSGDPSVVADNGWTVRRLAPDCSRVEFSDLPSNTNAEVLLRAMGIEAANVHMGTEGAARRIAADLKKRGDNWLFDAVRVMTNSVRADHEDWKLNFRR